MIPKECDAVPIDAATRADLIDLMARVLVLVFHEEGGSVNDRSFVQCQDQTGAPGSEGDRLPSAVQRKTSTTEYGKSTAAVCGGRTDACAGVEAGRDHQ